MYNKCIKLEKLQKTYIKFNITRCNSRKDGFRPTIKKIKFQEGEKIQQKIQTRTDMR